MAGVCVQLASVNPFSLHSVCVLCCIFSSQGNRARYTVDRMIRSSNGTDEDEEEGLYEEQFLSLKPSASRQLNRRGSTGSLPRSLAVETTKV